SDGTPRLSPAPFDEGTVQIVALNIQGGGGTNAPAPPPGAFVAVESILGATKPSLAGNNSAVFSLSLSQEGSIILDQAFRQGALPVGVIYDLKYTALRPALDVEITANFKHVYDHLSFSADLSASFPVYGVPVYLEAGIDMAFEKLKQDGVISIKVTNFSDAEDEAEKEKWALDFFKEHLLAQWFKPTLAPVTFDRGNGGSTGGNGAGGAGGSSGGGTAADGGGGSSGGASGGTGSSGGGSTGGGTTGGGTSSGGGSTAGGGASTGGGTPAGGTGAGAGGSTGGAPADGGSTGGAPSGGEMPGESAVVPRRTREVWAYPFLETGRQPARLERRVEPETPGYDIQLAQSAENDQVTLTFVGGSAAPTVRVDGNAQTLSDARQLRLDVPGGARLSIEADYPATQGAQHEFRLYFDVDKPRAPSWSVAPPSAPYRGYLTNQTAPLDARFQTSTGPVGAPDGPT